MHLHRFHRTRLIVVMPKPTDIQPVSAGPRLLPVQTGVPLKFGPETLTTVTCGGERVRVWDAAGM